MNEDTTVNSHSDSIITNTNAVIQQVEHGKQYREISKDLNVSVGSIAKIVKNSRIENGHERNNPESSPIEEIPSIQDQEIVESESEQEDQSSSVQKQEQGKGPYYHYSYPNIPTFSFNQCPNIPSKFNPFFNLYPNNINQQISESKPRRVDIHDTDYHVIKKTKEIEENSEGPHQSRSSTSNLEDHTSLGIDWDENH